MHATSARTLWIGNRGLDLGLDAGSGAVEGLHLRAVGRGLNFVLDAERLPEPGRIARELLGQIRGLARDRAGEWQPFDGAATECRVPVATGERIVIRRRWPEQGLESTMSWRAEPAGDRLDWSVELRNLLARPLEIGQLILPLGFNNWYHAYGMNDAGMGRLYQSTVYVHRHLAGPGSYVHLARLTGQGPDLLLLPKGGPAWRFSHHARWSLERYTSLVQWEGIALLYLAAAELEGARAQPPAGAWDRSVLQVPARGAVTWQMQLRGLDDPRELAAALAAEGAMPVQAEPGLVCPVDLELRLGAPHAAAIESRAGLPVRIAGQVDAAGYGTVRRPRWRVAAEATGESVLSLRTATGGAGNEAVVRWIPPLEHLIRRRARHVLDHQLFEDSGSDDDGGIFIRNNRSGELYRAPSDYWGPGCYEGGICDGLFAAEKNCLWPEPDEVARLERYANHFVWGRLQNPANHDVAWYFAVAGGGGLKTGRCFNYAHVANLYHALYRIGSAYALTRQEPRLYLSRAARTLLRMFEISWRFQLQSVGILGLSNAWSILDDLAREGLGQLEQPLRERMNERARQLLRLAYPYASECEYDTTSYEEVYSLAKRFQEEELAGRTLAAVAAARGAAPVWWWFGSDKRWWDALEDEPLRLTGDRGENCLHYTTPANAHVLLQHVEEEIFLPDPRAIWLGYGALLAPWALVAEDGSAAMCFCPDPASAHCGMNPFSGDVGLNLWYSLRGLKSYVHHPRRSDELFHFGCRVEHLGPGAGYVVEPRDGVRREIVFTSPRMRIRSSRLPIEQAYAARTQDRFWVRLRNPFAWAQSDTVTIEGVWGRRAAIRLDGAMQSLLSPLVNHRVEVGCGPLAPGQGATFELAAER